MHFWQTINLTTGLLNFSNSVRSIYTEIQVRRTFKILMVPAFPLNHKNLFALLCVIDLAGKLFPFTKDSSRAGSFLVVFNFDLEKVKISEYSKFCTY